MSHDPSSQDSPLNIQTLTPQQLDERERAFEESEQWLPWIDFTRALAQSQPDPEQGRAAWRRLVKRFEARAESAREPNPLLASDLLFLCGKIWAHELERDDMAMKAYVGAYKIDAENYDALKAARTLYEKHEEWTLALQLCALELELVEGPDEKAALLMRMAEISSEKLGKDEDAVRCVREAAKLIPGFKTPERYQALLSEMEGSQRDQLDKLIEEATTSKNPRHQARRYHEAADLLMKLDPQDPRVEGWLLESLKIDDRNDPAKATLQTFYQLNERWEALSAFLIKRLDATQRRSDRIDILKTLAYVNEHAIRDDRESVRWHREVLALNPIEDASIEFCVRYYHDHQEWQELVSVYDSALRMRRRGEDEGDMLFQIAMILWRKMSDYMEAEKYFKRIKLNDPRNPLMLNFYVDFYRQQEDWRRLLTALLTKQGAVDDVAEKVSIGVEMAELAEVQLESRDRAIEQWRAVLKIDPTYAPAHEALVRLYEESGKWSALVELIKEQIDGLDEGDVEGRVACLRRLVGVYAERLRQPVMVTNTHLQILDLDPNNEPSLAALEEIYRSSSHWAELAEMVERRAALLAARGDREALRERYRDLAELNRDRLHRPDLAVHFFEEMLDLHEALDAIEPLLDLYLSAKDWDRLFKTYQRKLSHVSDDALPALWVSMARLADEHLNAYAEAISLWSQVMEREPGREDAWEALTALYPKEARWGDLAAHFERCEASLEGRGAPVSQRLVWLKRRADLLADQLEDTEASSEVWWRVVELAPSDADAEAFLRALYLERRDWASLERVYEARGDWEGFVRQLTALSLALDGSADRVGIYRVAARVSFERLKDDERGVEALEAILREAPQDMEAALALAPFYRAQERWGDLEEVLAVAYDQSLTPSADLLRDLAHVNEVHLGRVPEAFAYMARALQLYPEDASWLVEARRVSSATRAALTELGEGDAPSPEQGALISTLETLVNERRDLVEQADEAGETPTHRFLWALAELYRDAVGDAEEAINYFERLRAAQGESLRVLTPLAALYESQGRWSHLLSVLMSQLDFAEESLEKQRIYARIGGVYEQQLGEVDDAEEAYRNLLALNEESLVAIRGLQRIAERRDDRATLAELIDAELKLCRSPADLANLNFRLGEIALAAEGEAAALTHFAAALSHDPLHEPSARALQAYVLEGSDRGLSAQAAALIEPSCRAREEWSLLAAVLSALTGATEDQEASEERRARRVSLLTELAALYEDRLADHRAAFEAYLQLLSERPEDEAVVSTLERLADGLDAWADLTAHWARLAYNGDVAADAPEGARWPSAMSRRLARAQEAHLGDLRAARDTVEAACAAEGDSLELIAHLDRLCASLEDWHALVEVRERQLRLLSTPSERLEVLFGLAQVWEEVIESPSDAVDIYRRALAEDASSAEAFMALERLLRAQDRSDDLAALLSARLELIEGEEAQQVGLQLAQVLWHKLNDPDAALTRLAEVLARGPQVEAVHAVERMLTNFPDGSEESRALRRRGCDLLEPLYEAAQDARGALRLLEVRLEDEEELAARVALHTQIAARLEAAGPDGQSPAPDLAFARYGVAFAEDFGNSALLSELTRLAEQLGEWGRLAALVRAGVEGDKAYEASVRVPMLRLAARLYEERLVSFSDAIHFHRLVLEEDPEDAAALAELARLYELAEDLEALAEILTRQWEAAGEDKVAAAGYAFTLGALYEERIADPARAIDTYQRIRLDVAPADPRAYEALERLFMQQGDFERLVEVYLDEVAQREALAEKQERLYKAAVVYEEHLSNPDEAIAAFVSALALDEADAHSLLELARLYESLERFDEQLEILARQKALATEQGARDTLELKRALVLKDKMQDFSGALAALREVLSHQPTSAPALAAVEGLLASPEVRLEAAELLAPLYEASGAWAQLVRVLHDTLEERSDFDERVATLRRVAVAEETQLADGRAAFGSLSLAYRLSQADAEIEAELERLAALVAADADLVALMQEVVSDAPEREVAIRAKIAVIAEERLGDLAMAISAHRDILHQEPSNMTSLLSLERLLTATEDYAALVEALEQRLDATEGAEARAALFAQIAQTQEERLGAPAAAIEVWRRQLEEVEGQRRALEELERLLMAAGAYAELAAHYEVWAEQSASDEERANVKTQLALVYETALDDGVSAVEMYREVLELIPAFPAAVEGLSALFAEEARAEQIGADRLVIAELLEPIYRAHDDAAGLVRTLAVKQEAEADLEARADLLTEMATLQESRLTDRVAAFASRLQVLRVAPERQENRLALQTLAHATRAYDELARGLEEVAAESLDPELKGKLLLELGKVYESFLDQLDLAGERYLEILSHVPGDAEAIRALEALYARQHKFQALVELYLRLADEAEGDEERVRRYFQACNTLQNLDAADQLIETYRKIIEVDSANARAFDELERLFKLTDQWQDLADLLMERIELQGEGAGRAPLRDQLARVYEEHLGNVDEAIECWRVILEGEDPSLASAYASLERLASAWRAQGTAEPRRQLIAELLAPLYRERGLWSEWLQTQDDLVEFDFDPSAQSERLLEVARVYEVELKEPAVALSSLARAFALNFGDERLQVEVDRLAAQLGAWLDLTRVYTHGIEACADPELALSLWLKVARAREEHLSDPSGAVEAYQSARALDPMAREPLSQLERLFEQLERYEELVEVLMAEASVADEVEEKKRFLFRCGALLCGALARPMDAVEVYRQVLLEDPEEARAAQALERIFKQSARWEDLVLLLQDRLSYLEDEQAQVATHHEVGRVLADELGRIEEAQVSWRQVLDIAPLDARALERLKASLTAGERWAELLALFEDERGHYEDDAAQAVVLDAHMAALHGERLGDATRAIELYRSVIERDATHEGARAALEGFMAVAETRLDAAEALKAHYAAVGDSAALALVYEAQLLSLLDPSERVETLKRLGALLRGPLKQPRRAFDAYANALREDLDDATALEELQGLGGELSLFEEMAAVYGEVAARDPHHEVSLRLLRARAKLCAHRLGRPADAIESWQAVRAVEPEDEEALKALTRLFEQEGRPLELIEVLQARVEIEPSNTKLRVQLGHLLSGPGADLAAGIEQWRLVLLDFPEVREAQEALEAHFSATEHLEELATLLEPIYRDQGRWDRLVALNDALLGQGVVTDAFRAQELWEESGAVYQEHLGDAPRALSCFLRAFELNPMDSDLRPRLFGLIDELKAWVSARPTIAAALPQVSDPELLLADTLRLARWAEEHEGDAEAAAGWYREALAADPQSADALRALERLYRAAGDAGRLAGVLRARVDAAEEDDARAAALRALAEVQWSQLGRPEDAARSYEELLALNDADASAYAALEQVLRAQGDRAGLIDLAERAVEGLSLKGEEAARRLCDAGALAREGGDAHRAVDLYRRALDTQERYAAAEGALEALLPEVGDWDALRELKDARLSRASGEQAVALALELAALCQERLMMPDDALEYYQRVLKVSPGHDLAFERASAVLREQMRAAELCELIEGYLDAADLSDARREALSLEVARLATEEGDVSLAIKHLNAVLALTPTHAEALTALARLYESEEKWEEAAATLKRALEHAAPGAQRGEAWRRLGLIYLQQLNEVEEAKSALRHALTESEDAATLDALAQLAREEGDDAAVFEYMRRKVPFTQGAERLRALIEVARLAKQAGDSATQLSALEAAYAEAPQDAKVVEPLVEIYIEAGRLSDAEPLVSQLVAQLEAARQAKPLSRALFRLGQLAEARGDLGAAQSAFERARAADATFASNLVALSRVLVARGDWGPAQDALRALLLQRQVTDAERVEIFYLNGLARLNAGDDRKAKEMFERALSVDAHHGPSREALGRLG
jgi:tetratricopeptide (TPR) repeat protein